MSNAPPFGRTIILVMMIIGGLHVRFFSDAIVLRLRARALDDLAQLTRQWMHSSVQQQFPLRSHSRQLAHRLGNGRLQLHNLTVVHFNAPQVRYQPSKNALIYMATDGGNAELDAQWSLQSDFLLSMIRSPAFSGSVRARITGFSSEVSIKVDALNELAMHQCISRFDSFQLQLGGSLAADLIHWFHRPLAQAMQSHVEETYCHMIGDKLLPWLREQLARLALKLHMEFGAELHLAQWLHSIRPGDGHLDLTMAQRLSSGSTRNGILLAEIIPPDIPTESEHSKDGIEAHRHSVSFFLSERTLQQLFSSAHHSHRLRANFSSPFLRTNCAFLCIGKIVPQMRSALGATHLLAVVRTNSAPIVRLSRHRIKLLLNVSFELFEHRVGEHVEVFKGDDEEDPVIGEEANDDREDVHGRNGNRVADEDGAIFEGIPEDPPPIYDDEEKDGENDAIGTEYGMEEDDLGMEEMPEHPGSEGTLIQPKLIGVHPEATNEQPSTVTITFQPPKSIASIASQTTEPSLSAEVNVGTTRTTTTTVRPATARHAPVVRILLDSELELLLVLDRAHRRLKTELNVKSVRAVLAQSQIQGLSQKTMDLMLDASVPFLENSVRILYRDGLELDDLLQLPTRNESVHVEPGFIQLNADLNLAQLLRP